MEWLAATLTGFLSIEVIRRAWTRDDHVWGWIIGGSIAIAVSVGLVDAAAILGHHQPWGYYLLWCYSAIAIAVVIVIFRD